MLRKPEGLRRWMTEMMTHQTLSTQMVSEDIISDDDLDEFIRNFSDMAELNLCIALHCRISNKLSKL